MKKLFITVFVFIAFALNVKAQSDYDFYDTCVTGQRLYYHILSDNSVAVVNGECDYYLLTGDMEIPSEVVHDGISYLVTYIGGGAFMNCSGLTSVNIPNSVTSIGDEAFYGCSGLTSLTIPNSVTSIGYRAFYGCSGMTSLTIPNSVTSIGGAAFSGCSGLITIIFEGTIPPTLAGCFSTTFPVSNDLTIYVPEGSQEDYEASFGPAASNITIIESNVGIENLDYTSAMNVYPNPTTGIVNVQCTMNNVQMGTGDILVYDAFGRLLQSTDGVETNNYSPLRTDTHGFSVQTTQIDLSHYAPGVYFVKAVAEGNVVAVRKIVKR